MLEGKKTYIIVVLMIITGVLAANNLITEDVYKSIMAILLPSSIGTLRMGVKK